MLKSNQYVREIKPYRIVHSLEKIKNNNKKIIFKLDWNESTITPSKKVINALLNFLKKENNINWYGDPDAVLLKKYIAKYCKIKNDKIIVTNGSDQALELICNTYLEENDEVIVPVPTYSNFLTWVKANGAKSIEVSYERQSKCNIEEITNKISSKTKLIYLINPYICCYDFKDIINIVKLAKNALVIIDEAYSEYHGKSFVKLVEKFDNVVITRSFSKALSMAGLRLGYLVSNKTIVDDLSKIHNFKSVNVLAQLAGIEILKDISYVKNYVKEIDKSIKLLEKELIKLNFIVIKTNAGFILFKHKLIESKEILSKLEKNGIFVRDLSTTSNLSGYLRMNVGTTNQTKKLIVLFKEIFSVKVIFLDRDGTIIEEPLGLEPFGGIINSFSRLKILPNTIKGLKRLCKLGYILVVVSNQDGINSGKVSLNLYNSMNNKLNDIFRKERIIIQRWLMCPHTVEEKCSCRKPNIDMIKILKDSYYIDFKHSYLIGDRESDIIFGKNLGVITILVKKNEKKFDQINIKPNYKFSNIYEAAKFMKKLK